MNIQNSVNHTLILLIGALALLSVPARAASYIQVSFLTVNEIYSTLPYSVDISDSQPNLGSARVAADLALGTIKMRLDTLPPGQISHSWVVYALCSDDFTIFGPDPVGTPINVTASITLNAQAVAPLLDEDTPAPGGQSFGSAAIGIGNAGRASFSFSTQTNVSTSPFPINLATSQVIGAQAGIPFSLSYFTRLEGMNSTSIDAFNTAYLGFDLPSGYIVTSSGGYVVPEPSSVALVLISLIVASLIVSCSRRTQRNTMA